MKQAWIVEDEDIRRVREFVAAWKDDPFVRERAKHNLACEKPPVSRPDFWSGVVACLLTTQQRSGPESAVTRFLLTKPFPLRLEVCEGKNGLAEFVRQVLKDFGGLRRTDTIARELQDNLRFLDGDPWAEVSRHLDALRGGGTAESERTCANYIDDRFCGFGPKQSRNLIQYLGLSRQEIPLDSRITKWLQQFGFPVRLSANALADRGYYEFVLDGVQELCRRSEVYPCILDAAIFTSFDGGRWKEHQVVW